MFSFKYKKGTWFLSDSYTIYVLMWGAILPMCKKFRQLSWHQDTCIYSTVGVAHSTFQHFTCIHVCIFSCALYLNQTGVILLRPFFEDYRYMQLSVVFIDFAHFQCLGLRVICITMYVLIVSLKYIKFCSRYNAHEWID